jgi:hypothetical protein
LKEENQTLAFFREWVERLLSKQDDETDHKTRTKIMASLGRICAAYHGDLEKAHAIQDNDKDLDTKLKQMNQQIPWCGRWVREGETINCVCKRCGCPLIREGLATLSPTHCLCSRGWVQAVFEPVLGTSVDVELSQAIGCGDPVCRFVIHYY